MAAKIGLQSLLLGKPLLYPFDGHKPHVLHTKPLGAIDLAILAKLLNPPNGNAQLRSCFLCRNVFKFHINYPFRMQDIALRFILLNLIAQRQDHFQRL